MDERSSLGTVSKRGCFFWDARARNTHVEATLNHSCPAQALATAYDGRDARSLTTKVAYKFKSGTHRHSIHVLFMKCRLRPVTDFGAEGTFTYQELILGLATLNLTFDVYDARALFATLGGGPGRVVHVKTLDTLLMAFWLRVTQTKRRNETEKLESPEMQVARRAQSHPRANRSRRPQAEPVQFSGVAPSCEES